MNELRLPRPVVLDENKLSSHLHEREGIATLNYLNDPLIHFLLINFLHVYARMCIVLTWMKL